MAALPATQISDPRAVTAARLWFGAIAVIIAVSLVIQLTLLFTGGQDANSGAASVEVPIATRLVRFFSFFTIQSNIFVLVTSVLLVLKPERDGAFCRVFRLDALLGITITGIVYDTILAPLVHLGGWALVATIGFHYIAPWATLLGWLVLGPRPRMGWRTVGFAFLWPVLWLVYTFVHGAVTAWYPYPFLNVTKLGYPDAVRNSLLVLVVGIVIAVILNLLDTRVPALLGRSRD